MSEPMQKSFWERNKKLIVLIVAVYVIMMLAMVLLASGPQNEPFVYQIF